MGTLLSSQQGDIFIESRHVNKLIFADEDPSKIQIALS